ncbi:hypothetical protein [Streptomyces sp. NPDC008125]|uniref:hypothetical protein n=1 Tax=Streptomyces sp. NPDC008125 TaxID=3364811 RepID=UPI0036EB3C32
MNPRMAAKFDGIRVSFTGEEGAMLALGHHPTDRVIAAFLQLGDDPTITAADLTPWIAEGWAVFTEDPDPDYQWTATEAARGTPGAVAVTILHA